MINFYYDRVVDGIHIPNGIPEKFVKYYTPNFNDTKFRVEINMEPAVYPSDMRHTEYSSLKSVDTIKDDTETFSGYYLIEGFGSAQNATAVNPETNDKYESVFEYIGEKSLKFLQNGVLNLCICYLQESFITDNIIHAIHYNIKRLNIQNSIVIVNDFLVEKRYNDWCKEIAETPQFKTIVFCHSLYEKSNEINGLLNSNQIYTMANDYKEYVGSAISLKEFKDSKSTLRKNTILSMNRRQREHRLATLCVLNSCGLLKGNGVSYQLTFDGPTTPYYVDKLLNENKQKKYYKDYRELKEMKYQWVDYPIAMEAKDGVTHGYGWENKQPYLDSYLNITTETDFLNPTGYASEKVWKPFGFFQPVLLVGSPNTLEFVKSFGFKTFDGFIDESYDKETDNAKRFELIEKEIIKFSKMSKQEVHDWYWSMEDILVHNFNLFMEYGKNREQNYKNLFEELK